MPEDSILYETPGGRFWVKRGPKGSYEVYESGHTHSTRVAVVGEGPAPRLGIERAKAEADRREGA